MGYFPYTSWYWHSWLMPSSPGTMVSFFIAHIPSAESHPGNSVLCTSIRQINDFLVPQRLGEGPGG